MESLQEERSIMKTCTLRQATLRLWLLQMLSFRNKKLEGNIKLPKNLSLNKKWLLNKKLLKPRIHQLNFQPSHKQRLMLQKLNLKLHKLKSVHQKSQLFNPQKLQLLEVLKLILQEPQKLHRLEYKMQKILPNNKQLQFQSKPTFQSKLKLESNQSLLSELQKHHWELTLSLQLQMLRLTTSLLKLCLHREP